MQTVLRYYLSVLAVAAATLILYLYSILWLRPEKLRRALRKQGITGPKPTFLLGNIPDMKRTGKEGAPRREQSNEIVHDYNSSLFPYFGQWRETYGNYIFYISGVLFSITIVTNDVLQYNNYSSVFGSLHLKCNLSGILYFVNFSLSTIFLISLIHYFYLRGDGDSQFLILLVSQFRYV